MLGNHMSLDQVIYELRKDRNKQFIDTNRNIIISASDDGFVQITNKDTGGSYIYLRLDSCFKPYKKPYTFKKVIDKAPKIFITKIYCDKIGANLELEFNNYLSSATSSMIINTLLQHVCGFLGAKGLQSFINTAEFYCIDEEVI